MLGKIRAHVTEHWGLHGGVGWKGVWWVGRVVCACVCVCVFECMWVGEQDGCERGVLIWRPLPGLCSAVICDIAHGPNTNRLDTLIR